MDKCPKCGKPMKKDEKICKYCGFEEGFERKKDEKKEDGKKNKYVFPLILGVIVIAIAAIGSMLLFSKQAKEEKLQKNLDLGSKYLEAAEYEKAIVAFNDALEIDEKSSDADLGLAKVYNKKEDPELAFKHLQKAAKNLENEKAEQKANRVVVKSGAKKSPKKEDWSQKAKEYETEFNSTSNLFKKQGNTQMAEKVATQKKEVSETITVIVKNAEPENTKIDVTITPKATAAPEAAEESEHTEMPELTEEPESIEELESTEEPKTTEEPEAAETPDEIIIENENEGESIIVSPSNEMSIDKEAVKEKLDKGIHYLETKDYDEAEKEFWEILDIDENSMEACLGLAKIYNEREEVENAFYCLKQVQKTLKETGKIDESEWFGKECILTFDDTIKKMEETNSPLLQELLDAKNEILQILPATDESEEASADADVETGVDTEINADAETDTDAETDADAEINVEQSDLEEEVEGESSEEEWFGAGEALDGIPEAVEDGTYVPEGSNEEEILYDDENDWDIEYEDSAVGEENTDLPEAEENLTVNEENISQEMETVPELSTEELYRNFISDDLLVQYQLATFNGSVVNYDGTWSDYELSGILGVQEADLDGDAVPELLVITQSGSKLSLQVYKAYGQSVELFASTTAICDGMGDALTDYTYGSTQVCFLKQNGQGYDIGIASYYFNGDAGDGTPVTRMNMEMYRVSSNGGFTSLVAVTLQNGNIIYNNDDMSTAFEGGKDSYINILAQANLSGNFVHANVDTINSMDLLNNPYQDLSVLPNPYAGGLAQAESGVQDLIIVSSDMQANTNSASMSIQDYTTFI